MFGPIVGVRMKPEMKMGPMAGVMIVCALLAVGCGQASPAPAAPAAPKAAEPTKATAPAPAAPAPTAAAAPTAAPAKKGDFPTKPISVIVPYAAGGAADIGARILMPFLEKELGTPIQVVNREGAGSQVGVTELAKAAPDGYTLSYAVLESLIGLYQDPARQTIFNKKSFEPIALHVVDPMVISVKSDSPYKTLKDLLDAAKSAPNKIIAGGAGVGNSAPHLTRVLLEELAGVRFTWVSFNGDAPTMPALLGGHLDVSFSGSSGAIRPLVQSGQARALAVNASKESRFYPGVKTTEAQGYKVHVASSRYLIAPAGVRKEVLDVLSTAAQKAIENKEQVQKLESTSGVEVTYLGPKELAAYWDQVEADQERLLPLLQGR